MKKIFALTLAVALVLSLASFVFAADDEYAIFSVDPAGVGHRKFSSDNNWVKIAAGEIVNYGNTIYYELDGETFAGGVIPALPVIGPVEKYDAVNGVRINQTWDIGGDWVSKVELVKKKSLIAVGPPEVTNYEYFLAITFKAAAAETATTDVIGEIVLKRTSGKNKINRDPANPTGGKAGETLPFPVNVELRYNKSDVGATGVDKISDSARTFDFKDDAALQNNEELELTFVDWGDARFTVNSVGQGKLVLKADAKFNSAIGALYPEANLDFFNGNGASFNKTGEMFIPAEEGSYIYELKSGVLVAIAGAEYDEYDEGFYFKTRTLGSYVVSDVELDLAGSAVVDPVAPEAPEVVNPSTGAAA
jgi:hypothetical protein